MNRSLAAGIMLAFLAPIAAEPHAPAVAQAPASAGTSLQPLVNDTEYQLHLTYRYNLPELQRRRDQLSQALEAWNASARTEDDRQRMAEWLRAAIRASMPGSQVAMPSLPQFEPRGEPEHLPLPPHRPGRPGGVPAERPAPRDRAPAERPAPSLPIMPFDEPPAEHTTLRPAPADDPSPEAPMEDPVQEDGPAEEASPALPASTDEEDAQPADDFWSSHPAIGDLPEDLTTDDPFVDDPMPTDEQLDDLFDW